MRGDGALAVQVLGVGVLGPGLPDWAQGRLSLREPAIWASAPVVLSAPARLPPAERRRSGAMVRLSLAVADQACAMAGPAVDPRQVATVFTSSSGDTANCHSLCEALAAPDRVVSPTRFTNSVHNATAGYWHIATQSRAPSTSLCGYDASLAAGLLEAAVQSASRQGPVLLVASDLPYPEPLAALRPLPDLFGMALLLTAVSGDPVADGSTPRLRLRTRPAVAGDAVSVCDQAGLEALRRTVPAAKGLPLLQALAHGASTQLLLEGFDGLHLAVELDAGPAS